MVVSSLSVDQVEHGCQSARRSSAALWCGYGFGSRHQGTAAARARGISAESSHWPNMHLFQHVVTALGIDTGWWVN
jgi:hypothetical protein